MIYDVIIIGAGIGGLSLAYRLAQGGHKVLLAERKELVGGVVTSVRRRGFLLEKGPNSFSNGSEMMELIEDIGLEGRMMTQPIRDQDRFVWKRGALRKVPMGPGELLGTDILTFGEKLRILTGLFKRFEPLEKDQALGPFLRQCLGDGVVDSLVRPFFAGVYASDADRVSFETTLPPLYTAARESTNLFSALRYMRQHSKKKPGKKAPRCLVSFPEGLEELTARLAEKIEEEGADLCLGEDITLSKGEEANWAIELGNGTRAEANRVVITSAADEAADLVGPFAPEAGSQLRRVDYAELSVVHVGVREDHFEETRNGFGFLTVDDQGVEALGIIWSSNIFKGRAPEGYRLLTCFYGGEKRPEANSWDDDKLRETLLKDLETTMKYRGGHFPLFEVERWKRALPIFPVGHKQKMDLAIQDLPDGIHLMANYLGQVSMPDRVKIASELLSQVIRKEGKEQEAT